MESASHISSRLLLGRVGGVFLCVRSEETNLEKLYEKKTSEKRKTEKRYRHTVATRGRREKSRRRCFFFCFAFKPNVLRHRTSGLVDSSFDLRHIFGAHLHACLSEAKDIEEETTEQDGKVDGEELHKEPAQAESEVT